MTSTESRSISPAASATVCPKCSHQRSQADTAPAWQCPACGIAYHKYAAYLERAARLTEARSEEVDVVADWFRDRSLWSLLVINVIVLGAGLVQAWPLADMMLIYWCQSVVIGFSYFVRILALDEFCTEDFKVNDQPVEATPATKYQTAFFFLVHFGFFNAGHLTFLVQSFDASLHAGVIGCALGFAANHLYSLAYNVRVDRRRKPNIGNLMFMPYLRIFPMHITLIIGGALMQDSPGGLGLALATLLFVSLKTAADVAMHVAEHRTLAGPSRTNADD